MKTQTKYKFHACHPTVLNHQCHYNLYIKKIHLQSYSGFLLTWNSSLKYHPFNLSFYFFFFFIEHCYVDQSFFSHFTKHETVLSVITIFYNSYFVNIRLKNCYLQVYLICVKCNFSGLTI